MMWRAYLSSGSRKRSLASHAQPIFLNPQFQGLTLPEVLLASVIVAIAILGTVASYNFIIQYIRGTGVTIDQSRLIDADLARIVRLSEAFTSCEDPEGSIPATPCAGTQLGNSFYYFPEITDPLDPVTWQDAEDFEAACRNGTLRNNFATLIGPAAVLGTDGNVSREAPVPVNGSNYRLTVTWVDPSNANRPLRTLELAPLVSAWCP